ncbi:MAG TPA: nucleotide exchange factor GrpE [Pyrinomonadaceae bacterium]|nr:nucleotide exchange factor GrpE [Pyrinomonadaceae bacterium]
MNSNQEMDNIEEFSDEIELSSTISVDDFIKELEAKEKDLHISPDLVIEVGESEYDERKIPEFFVPEMSIEIERNGETSFAGTNANSNASKPAVDQKFVSDLEGKVKELTSKVEKMESERSGILENSLRRQKDFENYRNRTERERRETYLNQISNLATQMLPVLDNLNRALDFAKPVFDETQNEFKQFFEGIVLVNQQLNEVLAGMGVQPIASIGERFDPHFHEAVATEESVHFPPNYISGELLRGYRIGDKVIRPAMVKVAVAPTVRKTVNTDDIFGDLMDISVESE